MVIRIMVGAIAALVLSGCASGFKDISRKELQENPLKKIEVSVKKERIIAKDGDFHLPFGAPFGFIGWGIAELFEYDRTIRQQKKLDEAHKDSNPSSLSSFLRIKIENLAGSGAFARGIEVETVDFEKKNTSGVPKLAVEIYLSPKSMTVSSFARFDFVIDNSSGHRFSKQYVSICDLNKKQDLSSAKELFAELKSDNTLIPYCLNQSFDEVTKMMAIDLSSDFYTIAQGIGTATYNAGDMLYLTDMTVLSREDDRVLLRSAKKPARIVLISPKNRLTNYRVN